ncbi:MAG: hypothetical protein LC647_18210, partial [Beggiatoa sp.]|nr:hypothetical protein [Beggiatoa sp.]
MIGTLIGVDFVKWARRDLWFLEEGAMLLLGADPSFPRPLEIKKGFEDIYDAARTSIHADTLSARGIPG